MKTLALITLLIFSACQENPTYQETAKPMIQVFKRVQKGSSVEIYLRHPGELELTLLETNCLPSDKELFLNPVVKATSDWCDLKYKVTLPHTPEWIRIKGFSVGTQHETALEVAFSNRDSEVHGTKEQPVLVSVWSDYGVSFKSSEGEEIEIDISVKDFQNSENVYFLRASAQIGNWSYRLSTDGKNWNEWDSFKMRVDTDISSSAGMMFVEYRNDAGEVFGPYHTIVR